MIRLTAHIVDLPLAFVRDHVLARISTSTLDLLPYCIIIRRYMPSLVTDYQYVSYNVTGLRKTVS
jgi:hypothetical protein